MTTKITLLQSLMDSNEQAQALATNAAIKGARIEAEGDNVIYFVRPEKLLLPVAKFIDSIGGEIENYPLWIEIDDASVEVPVGIKNRMLVAEDETETVKTWTEWRTPLVINDRIFIEMSDGRNYLKMSELTPVLSIIIKPADLPQQIEEL
jgi:hypothetical protein